MMKVLRQDYNGDYFSEEYMDKESGRHVIHQPIRTVDELEFAIFCIEQIARYENLSGKEVYDKVTKILPDTSTILDSYITPGSEVLATQGERYIIGSVIEVMENWGVEIWCGNMNSISMITDRQSNELMYKYLDIIVQFSKVSNLSLNESFHKFYGSDVYKKMSEGDVQEVLDRYDSLFVQDLKEELKI